MKSATASRRGAWLIVFALAPAVAAVIAYAQAPAPGMYGYDGPYHIKYSQLLRQDLQAGRGFARQFPQWQETFLAERWADKDLLYHLLLIPFTFGDLDSGGKTASIVFGTTLYLCLFLALRWAGAPAPALWTLASLVSSTTLLYRAGLVRSHVLAIALALLGAAAIARQSRAGTLLASAAYGYTHVAWHLLPGIALLYDGSRALATRRFRPTATLAALAGTAVAVVLNPYFPNNLKLWYVQNVDVLTMAWSPAAADLSLGLEFGRSAPSLLLFFNMGPALFTLAGLLFLLAARRPPGAPAEDESLPAALCFGALTLAFLGMSLMSRRFVEFWAPFSVLFAAVAFGRWTQGRPGAARGRRLIAGSAAALLALGLGAHNLAQTRRIIADDPGRLFDACAAWIRDNVPEGQTVFTTDWDEFPELFFTAPRQRYLVGLDPTFMYATRPERWSLWRDIVEGRLADIVTPIRGTLHCHFVFADAGQEAFIERADQDPMLRVGWRDPDCGVYALRDEAEPSIYPIEWRREGGASRKTGPLDFIDVAALGVAGDCATLHGTLMSPASARATMAISTDDRVTVSVNGLEVFDGAQEAPSLDEIIAQQRSGERRPWERRFGAGLAAGYNDVVVTTCRAGRAWGFFLRVVQPTPPTRP